MAKEKKERVLTDAEQKRLEAFEGTCQDLAEQGYKRIDLQVSIIVANIVAVAAVIVLFAALLPLFYHVRPDAHQPQSLWWFFVVLVVFLVLIVAHELVHGLTWSLFTPNGFKDIDFGIMRDSLTPYCTCREPLRKGPYIVGALMPMVVFGIIPIIIAFCTGNVMVLYLGIFMTVAAAGDVMIVLKILKHKQASDDVLLYDHPTEAGSVIFERETPRSER